MLICCVAGVSVAGQTTAYSAVTFGLLQDTGCDHCTDALVNNECQLVLSRLDFVFYQHWKLACKQWMQRCNRHVPHSRCVDTGHAVLCCR